MRSAVNSCHPSLWKLIKILQRDHSLGAVAIVQHMGGLSPEPNDASTTNVSAELSLASINVTRRDAMRHDAMRRDAITNRVRRKCFHKRDGSRAIACTDVRA